MVVNEAKLLGELINASALDPSAAYRLLQEHPTLLHARGGLGETALHFLAVEGYVDGVRFLATAGADVNSQNENGSTPLADAAAIGNAEMVRTLTSLGADPNAISASGDPALHWAIISGKLDVAEALLQAGADPYYRTELTENVYTALLNSKAPREAVLALLEKYNIGDRPRE